MTILNQKQINYTKQPMFFGEPLSLQRYDKFKYPAFDTLTQKQLGYFWRPEEIALSQDRVNYQSLSDAQMHIFTSNLKYQILLDSVQGRGPITALLPAISLPELETCVIWWDAFETIHSRTYTHMIKNVYSQPSEIFDHILDIPEIIDRAKSVTEAYDDFIVYFRDYRHYAAMTNGIMEEEAEVLLREKLYLALIAINILEGIRFYVSFACTFAFGENKLMEGSAKLIGLIARDENLHLSITQHIINLLSDKESDPLWEKALANTQSKAIQMYSDAVQQEKDWAKYLFQYGSIVGLSAEILGEYVEWIANRRMTAIGLPKLFDRSTLDSANPLPWTKNWLSSKGEQVAPQETQLSQYLVGALDKTTEISFDNFSL